MRSLTKGSIGERVLSTQFKAEKIGYEAEFRFHPTRRWRADFKIAEYPILVEVEGGTWTNGRHSRGSGFEKDCEKYNAAAKLGYFVIKGMTGQVRSGQLLQDVKEMIKPIRKGREIMNAAVQQHIMQVVDWSKYSLEGWLKQFGLWCGEGDNSSRMIIKERPSKRMSQKERERLIAEYMTDGELVRNQFKKTHSCLIDDNEARAVQKMWLDVSDHESDVLQGWLRIVWLAHVCDKSLREIVKIRDGATLLSVRQDLKCGIAYLASKNSHLRCDLLSKST